MEALAYLPRAISRVVTTVSPSVSMCLTCELRKRGTEKICLHSPVSNASTDTPLEFQYRKKKHSPSEAHLKKRSMSSDKADRGADYKFSTRTRSVLALPERPQITGIERLRSSKLKSSLRRVFRLPTPNQCSRLGSTDSNLPRMLGVHCQSAADLDEFHVSS